MKRTKTVTINEELLKWIDDMIEKHEFGSLSHAIEKGLYKLKAEYEQQTKHI